MTLTNEHYILFNAIEMWQNTLTLLCNQNHTDSNSYDYSYFIINANNTLHNVNMENDIIQVIHDFYDYFYINEHICDINSIHSSVSSFTNYGLGEHKMDLLDMIQNINGADNISVFQKITIYVFYMCISHRKELNLKIFEEKRDVNLVKYFTRVSTSTIES